MTPATKRATRSDKCPAHTLELLSADPFKRAHYQALWLSQGSWAAVEIYERKYQLELDTTQFIEEWLTEGQLMRIYREKDVVRAIIEGKEPSQIKDHAEAKECKKARQYLCKIAQRHIQEITRKEGSSD